MKYKVAIYSGSSPSTVFIENLIKSLSNSSIQVYIFGNESENPDDELGLDYNRVRLSILETSAGIVKNSDYGSTFFLKGLFQGIKVDENDGLQGELVKILGEDFVTLK